MTKSRIHCLFLALLLVPFSTLFAESSVWVASNGTSTVYLAGSVHVLRAADYPLPPEFERAYRQAGRVALEVSLAEMENPAVREKLQDCAVYKDGTTIQEHLSPKAYARVKEFCEKRKYPLARLQACRPWSLAMTLMMLELHRLGVEPTNGVDRVFDARAHQDAKPVEGLETVDEQIGFLTLIDKGLDDDQIIQSIAELEDLDAKLSTMIQAWRTGDEKGLQEVMLKEFTNYPNLYQALLVDRNRKWLAKIEGFLKGPDRVLVVVGAAHLVGDDSVVAMLRKKGYKVEKLGK